MTFNYYAHFYQRNSVNCRSSLLITRKNISNIKEIPLLVVMMNPGSSKEGTTDTIYNFLNLPHKEAIPDNTQEQIVKIMQTQDYHSALIINLSDVRDASSASFCKNITGLYYTNLGKEHSVFSQARSKEFDGIKAICKKSTIIFACGVNYKLRFLTQYALNKFSGSNIFGLKNHKNLFFHPLPRNTVNQQKWIRLINQQISSNKNLKLDGTACRH